MTYCATFCGLAAKNISLQLIVVENGVPLICRSFCQYNLNFRIFPVMDMSISTSLSNVPLGCKGKKKKNVTYSSSCSIKDPPSLHPLQRRGEKKNISHFPPTIRCPHHIIRYHSTLVPVTCIYSCYPWCQFYTTDPVSKTVHPQPTMFPALRCGFTLLP